MIKFRNLDKVRFLMQESTGLDVGYAYDDLVFSEHGLYIIRFEDEDEDEDEDMLYIYFNKDIMASKQKMMLGELNTVAMLNKIKLVYKGKFEMEQKEFVDEFELKLYEMPAQNEVEVEVEA